MFSASIVTTFSFENKITSQLKKADYLHVTWFIDFKIETHVTPVHINLESVFRQFTTPSKYVNQSALIQGSRRLNLYD